MNYERTIKINFSMPFSAQKIFHFIIQASNMPLYPGFLLVPGIKNVISSDPFRKVGTIDKVTNLDGSSHQSVTDVLIPNQRYSLTLDHIEAVGFKKKLANPIRYFREDWLFKEKAGETFIERNLTIVYEGGFFNHLFIMLFIAPQIKQSLLLHHLKVQKALSA